MPTPDGPIGNPRFDVQDPPKFPVHLTEVSDFFAALATPAASYADLLNVPQKFPGMLKVDRETNGLWEYTGSSWTRINSVISDVSDSYSSSAQGDGGNVLTFNLPSRPFPTRVALSASGAAGFRAAASKGGAHWTASAGTLNGVQISASDAPPAQWSAWSAQASLDLPAGSSSTVRLVADTSINPYFQANANVRRISAQ